MDTERKEDLQKIKAALLEFKNAWSACEDVFFDVDEGTLNDVICEGYPFELSFDEQTCSVIGWCWDVIERIDKKLEE